MHFPKKNTFIWKSNSLWEFFWGYEKTKSRGSRGCVIPGLYAYACPQYNIIKQNMQFDFDGFGVVLVTEK